jgi:hypothetical protein
MKSNELRDYVSFTFPRELAEVKNSAISKIDGVLSIEERTLIYKYTEDGYEELNEQLRISKGKEYTKFGRMLDSTLSRLPNYEDVVYRAANLTPNELQKYLEAKNNKAILVEHSFISASKSKNIAYGFGSCQFLIISKSGKDIELFAKYGFHHPQNEKEVLFRPNLGFRVLDITKEDKYTLIVLEESKIKS